MDTKKTILEIANQLKLFITCDEAWLPLMEQHDNRYLFYIKGWELIFEFDDHVRIGDINANYINVYPDKLEIKCIDDDYFDIIGDAVFDTMDEFGIKPELVWL